MFLANPSNWELRLRRTLINICTLTLFRRPKKSAIDVLVKPMVKRACRFSILSWPSYFKNKYSFPNSPHKGGVTAVRIVPLKFFLDGGKSRSE